MTYPGSIEQMEQRDVVITAGGTREPIDDVRFIGNFSGGALGHALAQEFKSYGRDVLLLAPKNVTDRYGEIDDVEHQTFSSYADLDQQIKSIPSARIVLQAAAVADYSPVPADGKISSDQDEMVIRMQKNPKILASLREHFGRHAFIVGFKLLSGVSTQELLEVGRRQITTNYTDMSVANDLQHIRSKRTVHSISKFPLSPINLG